MITHVLIFKQTLCLAVADGYPDHSIFAITQEYTLIYNSVKVACWAVYIQRNRIRAKVVIIKYKNISLKEQRKSCV